MCRIYPELKFSNLALLLDYLTIEVLYNIYNTQSSYLVINCTLGPSCHPDKIVYSFVTISMDKKVVSLW